ncbi:MAG: ribose-5-phosphate isomerase RpiA [Dehalococcoidia bacterium]
MNASMFKRQAAEQALAFVRDGQVVGLGTGSTAEYAIRGLAVRVREGLQITGVPTSEASARHARELGIAVVSLNDVASIDVTIDGADEVDPQYNLIKGAGGALTREKLVARATRQQIIVVDSSKLVDVLGAAAYPLPVEVLPFGWRTAQQGLALLGCDAELRIAGNGPTVTDNGNYVIDCRFGGIPDPAALEAAIKQLPGVVDSGLFVGLTAMLVVAGPDGVEVIDIAAQRRTRE